MQITRPKSIQALPILFLIFLFQTLFLFYIDEGYYSFNHLVTPTGLIEFAFMSSLFTLIGFMLFAIINKVGNLSFLAKIIFAAVFAAPTAAAIWYMLYLTFKSTN